MSRKTGKLAILLGEHLEKNGGIFVLYDFEKNDDICY